MKNGLEVGEKLWVAVNDEQVEGLHGAMMEVRGGMGCIMLMSKMLLVQSDMRITH